MGIRILVALGLILLASDPVYPQYIDYLMDEQNDEKEYADAKAYPRLSIEFFGASRLKAAVRKPSYRLDEIMVVDMVLLNSDESPFWINIYEQPEIQIKNGGSQMIKIIPYKLTKKVVLPNAYRRLQPNRVIRWRMELLVGCSDKPFKTAETLHSEDDNLKEFENELFAYYGDGCIDLRRRGVISIAVKLTNSSIILSKQYPDLLTAVGQITSKPFQVRIE